MEFKQLVLERQSDRSYSNQAVEEEKIQQCIDSARMSPSACNAQPWKFIVIDEPDVRQKVAEDMISLGMNSFAVQAPVIIAIILEKPTLTSKIGSVLKGKEFTLLDIGIAVSTFCLQATELGLGTCIVGWFNEKNIRKTLSIPSSKRIPLLITLGYAQGDKRTKKRKKKEEVYARNAYFEN